MKSILVAVGVVLLMGSTACGAWYYGPNVVYYSAPAYAYAPPVYTYAQPSCGCSSYVAYSPYVTYAPYVTYSPYVAYSPAFVASPAWVGPRGRVYYPGQPVRNVAKAVWP